MAVFALGFSTSARADIDLEATALIGSGVDTGNNPDNPYALQVGGAVELILSGYVLGVRATRAVSTGDTPSEFDFRSFGGDFGFEWEIALLHIGPRLGLGRVSTLNEDFSSFYLEPGGVAEVEVGWFVAGADIRYRVVTEEADANGLLAYAKLGLRF
jgi:hypothetical protein